MLESTGELQERAARNQVLFREVNERIEGLPERMDRKARRSEWVCECANTACFERVEMSLDEYEAVRQVPTHFVIFPAIQHVYAEAERRVKQTDRYWVVEKIERAASVAAEFYPRG